MALYIYYDKGGGVHESKDDVALVKAKTKKEAVKKLSNYLTEVDEKKIIKGYFGKYNTDKVIWVSDY